MSFSVALRIIYSWLKKSFRFLSEWFHCVYILSVVSDFQSYIHIRPLALYIVGIKHFLASSFQNMALAAQLTVVQTSPFVQDIIQTFFSCGWFNRGRIHSRSVSTSSFYILDEPARNSTNNRSWGNIFCDNTVVYSHFFFFYVWHLWCLLVVDFT